jgi:hypothetical protein
VIVRSSCRKSVFHEIGVAGVKVCEKNRPAVVVVRLNDAAAGVIASVPLSARVGATAELDSQMVARYYDLKGANGYSPEQIERKRLSLEGVLVPVTAKWNEELLHGAGFQQVDCFWRWMNFAGWIALK